MMTNQFAYLIWRVNFPSLVKSLCHSMKLWASVGVIPYLCRCNPTFCWKLIGASSFQVQQAWHPHTVSIQMIQHNPGMWLAALSLMAVLQLFRYSWRVGLTQNQKTHPTTCQVSLLFFIEMIRVRAQRGYLLLQCLCVHPEN